MKIIPVVKNVNSTPGVKKCKQDVHRHSHRHHGAYCLVPVSRNLAVDEVGKDEGQGRGKV